MLIAPRFEVKWIFKTCPLRVIFLQQANIHNINFNPQYIANKSCLNEQKNIQNNNN